MNREERVEDNQFYHVYNRGNDRERIFGDESDYHAFLEKIRSLTVQYSVAAPIYALMPNHYHLVALQNTGGNLSKMMGALATSAAKRYNLKYGHIGHLFQGPFRYKPVPEDAQWDVACYIHLNPVRAGLVEDPAEWRFSNFADYVGPMKVNQRYAAYVRQVLKNERMEKEYWKRVRLHLEGFLPPE
jgi:REP element-mobilizing transposase RayT